jgi:hypothetical protein
VTQNKKPESEQFLKIGAYPILFVMILPFASWVTSNIFDLRASVGTTERDLKDIKEMAKSTEERSRRIELDTAEIKAKLRK